MSFIVPRGGQYSGTAVATGLRHRRQACFTLRNSAMVVSWSYSVPHCSFPALTAFVTRALHALKCLCGFHAVRLQFLAVLILHMQEVGCVQASEAQHAHGQLLKNCWHQIVNPGTSLQRLSLHNAYKAGNTAQQRTRHCP